MAASICQTLDGLAAAQLEIQRRLNRKFNALLRLSQLLEQLGDVTVLFPNLSNLIPVVDIDFNTYESLRQNCQFLNLPPAEGNAATAVQELRRRVTDAYAVLLRQLSNSPNFRLGKIQEFLNKSQGDVNMAFAIAGDYLRCAQAACNTVGAVGSTLQNIASADLQKEAAAFTQNFVTNGGKVLSQGAQIKYDQTRATVDRLKELSADVGADVQATVG